MSIIIIVIAVIFFIILSTRISSLEEKVRRLSASIKPQVSPPVTPPASMALNRVEEKIEEKKVIENIPESIPATLLQKTLEQDKKDESGTEFAVGSKVLTGVGVLALILGVGFFLRYAFENNLISETMRVIVGAIFGLGVATLGHFLREKYTQYANVLIGAGLGILYLSIYAAYGFYGLIDMIPAFALLIIITAAGVGMALSYNSKALVGYAFLGAFIIPVLLPLGESVHVLFMYLFVLNAGVLLTARFKIWPEFTIGSLAGTCILFLHWVYGPYTEALFMPTILYGTGLFILYFITSLLNFVFRDRDYKGVDGFLLYSIPTAYFILMLTIIRERDDIALLAALIGFFYVIFAIVIRAGFGQLGDLKKFSNSMLCIASPFLAAAIMLHFDGSMITILWAIEALVLVSIGYLLETSSNRIAGICLLVINGIRAFAYDLGLPAGSDAVFNARSATLFFVVITCLVIWKIYNSYITENLGASKDEISAGRNIPAFGLFAGLTIWATIESQDFINEYILYLPIVWMIIIVIMISLGALAKEKILRVLSYILLLISLIVLCMYQNSLGENHLVLFNIRVGSVLLFVLVCAYILWLFKAQSDSFEPEEKHLSVTILIISNVLVIWAFSLEIISHFNRQMVNGVSQSVLQSLENTKRVSLSAFWLVYALAGLGIGIFKKSVLVRYASIILFAITVFKIFLYDTANLSDVYRFISFITLGVILLIAGFAYYKFKSRILEFVSGEAIKEPTKIV